MPSPLARYPCGAPLEQNAQPTSRRRTRSVPAVPSPPARHQPPLHQTTPRSRRRGERAPGPPVTLGPHHPPRPGASPARGGATAGGSARGRLAGLVARGTEIKLRFRGKEWGGGEARGGRLEHLPPAKPGRRRERGRGIVSDSPSCGGYLR